MKRNAYDTPLARLSSLRELADRHSKLCKTSTLDLSSELGHLSASWGWDWTEVGEVLDQLESEIQELRQAVLSQKLEQIIDELGDVHFTWIQVARHLGVAPNSAIEKSETKFINRLSYILDRLIAEGQSLENFANADFERLWTEAKNRGL